MQRDKQRPELDTAELRRAVVRKLGTRNEVKGEFFFPCVPALAGHYVRTLSTVFEAIGRAFDKEDLATLRGIVDEKLKDGWEKSPFSRLHVEYHTDNEPDSGGGVTYSIRALYSSIEQEYSSWVANREPPLFGSHADAKVLEVAKSFGLPENVKVLDAGAGTGRNALHLARLGYVTDALEPAPPLVAVLHRSVEVEGLKVGVFEGDILDRAVELRSGGYDLIVLAEVVASHFHKVSEVRALFERAVELLAPNGILLFNAFMAVDAYKPDAIAREFSHYSWSCIFTNAEVGSAAQGLPLELVSDESVYEYEKAHLPSTAWPPTGWFEDWSRGCDIFVLPDKPSPVELRWLAYRRK